MPDTVLRLEGITKRFGALRANDAISLALERGEVLALLGENGAGKSTLVSILFGHYVADAGTIEAFGRPLPPGDPAAALAAGIGMVHQHSTLADNLSVLDNVMLGTEPLWRPVSRRREGRARLVATAKRFGLAVDPDARVAKLSVGERQRVEILKALYRDARVLILDEPTAVLTPQESEALFATLRGLCADGLSIIFISHKLDEVLRVSDRIAVLRAGKLVATLPAAGTAKSTLAEVMVGRPVPPPVARPHVKGDTVCVLDHVVVRGERAGERLDDLSLSLRSGEITAIAGVSGKRAGGAGRRAVRRARARRREREARRPSAPRGPGRVDRGGRRAHSRGSARRRHDRRAAGVGERDRRALPQAVRERGVVRRAAARAFARKLSDRYDVRGAGIDAPAAALSGGNMQKLIVGRALSGGAARADQYLPALVVASQPTWASTRARSRGSTSSCSTRARAAPRCCWCPRTWTRSSRSRTASPSCTRAA
jgi:simple sugar transport system ATP-binding protein